MDKTGLTIDLRNCGFKLNPNTHRWVKEELISCGGILPATRAMYFDYDSKYQYSSVKKLK